MTVARQLTASGVLSQEAADQLQAEALSSRPRRPVAALLDERNLVSASDLAAALRLVAREDGIPFFETIRPDQLALDVIEKIPVDWARQQLVIPVRIPEGIGMVCTDPAQLEAAEELRIMAGEDVFPVLGSPAMIRHAIEQAFFSRNRSSKTLMDTMAQSAAEQGRMMPEEDSANDLLRQSDQAPVAQLVNTILLEALKARASDIHIEPFARQVQIRFRIDGMLYEQASPPRNLLPGLVSRLKVMSRLDIAEKRLPQDGTASVRIGQREVDIRVSTMPVAEGERVVLRLLHRGDTLLDMHSLGMDETLMARFRKLLEQTQGVILITGPTGSGKTTTLYAALQCLDRRHLNVMTIEDPVEYQLPGIGQIQVKPQIGLTFASGLRHILRQDPDIVLVGETRDLETAEIMIRASLTGHLVFTTLHTNDAPSALVRLVDMGIEPYLLSSSVKAVLAQRLVRRLCRHCRVEAPYDPVLLNELGVLSALLERGTGFQPGPGCASCYSGYAGRLGVYELFVPGESIQDILRTSQSAGALRKAAVDLGMRTLLEDGVRKAASGETSLQEVLRVCGDHGA